MAVDLGSNTVKRTIADVAPPSGATPTVIEESVEFTRIGEGLDATGSLAKPAMDRTIAVLRAFKDRARELEVAHVACVATAGLRGAQNAEQFVARARAEAGIDIEVIDGLREAALTYRAPAAAFGPGPLIVVDVGGRSTEIIVGAGPAYSARVSLEIGGVRLTERFLPTDPPTASERQALEAHVRAALAHAPSANPDAALIGVSGTAVSLMGVHLGHDDIRRTVVDGEGGWLPKEAVETALEDLAVRPAAARRRGTVIGAGRADVIVAGATILLATCDHYQKTGLRVTSHGVRFGLLAEMVDRLFR